MREMGTAMMGTGSPPPVTTVPKKRPREAISSPLLEDVDLAGAPRHPGQHHCRHGHDHRRVRDRGNAVKAFASENATVVVGTVIDPEMHDELRVTVVATGIGAERKPDITLVKNNMVQERPARQPLISEALQSRVMEEAPAKVVNAEPQARREPDYLDIPAFLRKQARLSL